MALNKVKYLIWAGIIKRKTAADTLYQTRASALGTLSHRKPCWVTPILLLNRGETVKANI